MKMKSMVDMCEELERSRRYLFELGEMQEKLQELAYAARLLNVHSSTFKEDIQRLNELGKELYLPLVRVVS